ncbi:CBS domain-containing protein, partial [bacterium]|nr:CBS domain-containing protein [bacterium]
MKKVKDIMVHDVITIDADATISKAVALMSEKGVRSLIVNRRNEEDAYGVITETDIVYKVAAYSKKDPNSIKVHEIMT